MSVPAVAIPLADTSLAKDVVVVTGGRSVRVVSLRAVRVEATVSDWAFELSCRRFKYCNSDLALGVSVPDCVVERDCMLFVDVVAELVLPPGAAVLVLGLAFPSWTGHRLHTCRVTSQKTSISNRSNPTARRFEKQFCAAVSS